MRTNTRPATALATLLTLVGTAMVAASWPAAAADVCQGFDREHTVTRLTSRHAFSSGSVQSVAELQSAFARHADDIRAALAGQGLGDEVADALLSAVRQGAGITEQQMQGGERLQWMTYRKDGEVATIADVCLDLPEGTPAFEIIVPVAGPGPAVRADCRLDVTTHCQPSGTSTFEVHAAPGGTVTMAGPSGTHTVIEGGSSAWTGPMDDPYRADYTFTVTNQAATAEKVTTYMFLVPEQCMNLSLVSQAQGQRAGAPVTCTDTRTLTKPVCPVEAASCTIEWDAVQVRRGQQACYEVTGHWTKLDLELDRDGQRVAEPGLSGPQGTLMPPKRGTYTLVGTATNEVGATHTCRASVDVVGARWVARVFGAYVIPDSDQLRETAAPGAFPADTSFGYDNGFGLGLSAERLLGDYVGLELRGLYAWLDDDFRVQADELSATGSSSRGYWDLSLGLNLHVLPDSKVDWYLGPFVGYSKVKGDSFQLLDRSLRYDSEGDFTWGAQTGLDWPFGEAGWALHLGARYTWYTADITYSYTDPVGASLERSRSLDLNPVTLELGLAYRF